MSNLEELSKLFGTDLSKVTGHATEEPDYPDTVPGRVLNIDGDFLAYQVSADDTKSLEDMMHNYDVAVETLRLLAGAEEAVCHLTDSNGDKGGRYDIAIQKEYQGNRKDKVKPKYLHTIKNWMEKDRTAMNWTYQEADDGLCQANVFAIKAGTPELSVLCSKDKDLQMCPGWHINWDTGELEYVEGFGHIELDRSKASPKIRGKGTAYFWCQLLTGDSADNIQGLPLVPGRVLNAVSPTAPITKALQTLADKSSTAKQIAKANSVIAERKPGACGAVTAYAIMERIKSDKSAFAMMKTLYKEYGDTVGFKHWKTGEPVDWNKVLLSEAQLLWMRREPDHNDVVKFFKECV